MQSEAVDRMMLARAARAAARGFGHVEPNPMVGCVIGRPDGTVLGIGHHSRFGGPHAEVEALESCRRAGHDPRGATAWVTLEPCSHFGKQPPCADALIRAGLARVVAARVDPNPISTGGAQKLQAAGIRFEIVPEARALSVGDPFVKRISLGLPWVIAKWAQSIDGKIADRRGASQWISGPASRRRVHALRGRVDCILTAIGTVRADNPLLTARGVRPRRTARRVVIDPSLSIDQSSALVRSASQAPLIVITAALDAAGKPKAEHLRAAGVEVIAWPAPAREISMRPVLRWLLAERNVSTVLIEAGPGLLGRLFSDDLIDEAHVFTGPLLLGDLEAPSAARAGADTPLAAAKKLVLQHASRVGTDAMTIWRRHGFHLPVGASGGSVGVAGAGPSGGSELNAGS